MKIPYKMQAAVGIEQRRAQMLSAIARPLPRLTQHPIDDTRTLHIAGYGPSLQDTWKDLGRPCLSMSGATRFLADKGFVPDYHCDMDARPHKRKMIDPPVPGVTYFIASVCEPAYFDQLSQENVVLWHVVSSGMEEDLAWLSANDFGQLLVSTGSNIGLGSIQLGGALGFRRFEIHGFDHSVREDDSHHAGPHTGKIQTRDLSWTVNYKKYYTSRVLANGAAELINSLRSYPIFCVFHGEGLVQALVEEENLPNACTIRQPDKVEFIRRARIDFPNYPIAQNAKNAWEALCFSAPDPDWIPDLQAYFDLAEKRRESASFNTGSISLETALLIRSVCAWRKPKIAVEVGTFIGKSTYSILADHVYTCDKDNDCLPASSAIHTYPLTSSREMFADLVSKGIRADLFFFDGRIGDDELQHILTLSAPGAVYLFDDYHDGPTGKGMANLRKLSPLLKDYVLVPPYEPFRERSTLAMLLPLHLDEASQ